MKTPLSGRRDTLHRLLLASALGLHLAGCLMAGGGIETGNTQVADGGGIETGNTGSLAGRIRDEAGNPVAGAEVGLTEVVLTRSGLSAPQVHTVLTDSTGAYRFAQVPFGRYSLFATGRGETPLAGILTRIRHNQGGGIETGNTQLSTQLADLTVRHKVRLRGRVLPAPGVRIDEVVACIPGTHLCTSPGPDSVYTFHEAPRGAYEVVFIAGKAAHYLTLDLQAVRSGAIYLRDVALGDSGLGLRAPYRFYDTEQLDRSLSVMPVEYPAGAEPSWYAGKDFSSVKHHLLNDGPSSEITSVDFFDQWSMSRELTGPEAACGTDLAAPLQGFPVPIRLTAANFDFAKARRDGGDLIVSDGKGRLLPHEIERWDSAAGKAEIWVRLDTLAALQADRKVVLHWGRPDPVPVAGGAGVFRSKDGFLGVWHLADRTTDGRVRESRGLYDGFAVEGYRTEWKDSVRAGEAIIAGGHRLGNSGAFIHVDHRPGLEVTEAFTLSIWGRSWNPFSELEQVLASKMGYGKQEWRLRLLPDGTLDLELGSPSGWPSGCVTSWVKVPRPDQWHLYTATFDRGEIKLYVDGVELPSRVRLGGIPASVSQHGVDLRIGSDGDPNHNWEGSLDDFTYYDVAKPAAWIDMLYQTQKP